jgi:hypothetical protein
MKEELTQFFWIPFSPWPMVFVLAVIGFAMATLITFSFGKKHAATKTALLIPVVIVVGFCAIQAMGVLAGGRLAQLLELPDAEIKKFNLSGFNRSVTCRSAPIPKDRWYRPTK